MTRKIEALYENLWKRRWSEVIGQDEFDQFEDALGVYAIQCPDEGLYWIVLFMPYSLDDSIQLSEWNKIARADADELRQVIFGKNWSVIR